MEKRTLLAVLLILVVFWISSEFIWKNKNTQVHTEQKQEVEKTEKIKEPVNNELSNDSYEQNVIEPENDIEIINNIVLENEFIKLTFSNLGAVINSIQLKKFFLKDKITPAELIPENEFILNIELSMHSGSISNLSSTAFQYSVLEDSKKIIFIYQTERGMVEKIFELTDNYGVNFNLKVTGYDELAGYNLNIDSGIADTEEYLKMKSREYKVVGLVDNIITKYSLSKLKENREATGIIGWTAVKSKYFVMAIMPDELVNINKLLAFKNNDSPAEKLTILLNRANIEHNYAMYFGPLDYENLKSYDNGIENVVDMGPKFLQWISKIFVAFLKFLGSFIPSWGFCIIIFAILLKIILYPLTHKSFESSTKMQKINPLMKEIQQKYKSDPQKMNAELKKLYKEHGVNPLGGCLPMLLQMPILFALYPILRYSIDLRQTSFLWLPDLSEPDPIWLLPILMAVFMFVQQKLMTPSKQSMEEMDEKQKAAQQSQKMMMYFMPIMMFFIFKSLSSGLVLYWTMFSIIGSIQQYIIKKKFNKE